MKRFVWKIFKFSVHFKEKSAPLCIQQFLLSYVNWLLNSCKNSNEALDSGVLLYLNWVYILPKIYLRQMHTLCTLLTYCHLPVQSVGLSDKVIHEDFRIYSKGENYSLFSGGVKIKCSAAVLGWVEGLNIALKFEYYLFFKHSYTWIFRCFHTMFSFSWTKW